MTAEAFIVIVVIVSMAAGVAAGATVAWSRQSARLDAVTERLDALTMAASSRFDAANKQADASARTQARTDAKLAATVTRIDRLARLIRDVALGVSAQERSRSSGPTAP